VDAVFSLDVEMLKFARFWVFLYHVLDMIVGIEITSCSFSFDFLITRMLLPSEARLPSHSSWQFYSDLSEFSPTVMICFIIIRIIWWL
jgi:hypothetical protein